MNQKKKKDHLHAEKAFREFLHVIVIKVLERGGLKGTFFYILNL